MALILIIGICTMVFGYLIAFKNKVDLVAGDTEEIKKQGYRFRYPVGIGIFLTGLLLISYSILGYYALHAAQAIVLLSIFALIFLSGVTYILLSFHR